MTETLEHVAEADVVYWRNMPGRNRDSITDGLRADLAKVDRDHAGTAVKLDGIGQAAARIEASVSSIRADVSKVNITLSVLDERTKNHWDMGRIIAGTAFMLILGLYGKLFWPLLSPSGVALLEKLAVQPVEAATLKQANEVLDRDSNHEVPPEVIRALGQNVIQAAGNPALPLAETAWKTATKVVEYKSAQNVRAIPFPQSVQRRVIEPHFKMEIQSIKDLPANLKAGDSFAQSFIVTIGDDVPIAMAARMEAASKTLV